MDNFNQFLDKIEFINYKSDNKKVYEDLIKDSNGKDICRGLIHPGVIEELLTSEEIEGYVAKINGKYVGFVLFKHLYDTVYLSLIATRPKLGLPLGQILLTKMEEYAIARRAMDLQCDAIPEAYKFYIKMGWEVVYQNQDSKEYSMKKNIYKQ